MSFSTADAAEHRDGFCFVVFLRVTVRVASCAPTGLGPAQMFRKPAPPRVTVTVTPRWPPAFLLPGAAQLPLTPILCIPPLSLGPVYGALLSVG